MNVTKALALLMMTIAFWLSAAKAAPGPRYEVTGTSPITKRLFAHHLDCRLAAKRGLEKAGGLCRSKGHRGVDHLSVKIGGCWTLTQRSVKVRFSCE